ncbi:MAG: PEP-CTERM system histidine kinase PrsK [Nitrospiraceae bacterium]|nr:MAG: PEP-CTERM system histidine kinase PrsK [Nitrospiraceae bacterium]
MLAFSLLTGWVATAIALAAVFRRHRRLKNILLAIGLISTAAVVLGDAMCMSWPELLFPLKKLVLVSESVMAAAWLLFSLTFARKNYWERSKRLGRLSVFLFPLVPALFLFASMEDFFSVPAFRSEQVLFLGTSGYIFHLILLSYAILAIINLEITLRSSRGNDRWELKYIILGVGGILAINIFYHSHALLYRSISMYLLPVRTGIVLISMILTGLSVFRHRALDTEFAISRKVIYSSLSLIIIGTYLLGLGLIGEGMRYMGPQVGRNITTFLGFVGALLVLIVIFSERIRRNVTVHINKHFFSQKYDYREQWLQFTQMISVKHGFNDLLRSVSEGFREAMGVKGAAVWLKDRGTGEYLCARATDACSPEVKPGEDLLAFLKTRQWVLNVRHEKCSEITERSRDFITKTRASLIVPLLDGDDLTGFVVLREGRAHYNYNYEDYDLLKTLARQATSVIVNTQLSADLAEAKEMEAVGRLSSFIIHDLKNATSMLKLIAHNAEEHMDNPEFQKDAIKAIADTAGRMKAIIGKLKNIPLKQSLSLEKTDLGTQVRAALEQFSSNGWNSCSLRELEPVQAHIDREEIARVIVNLVINAHEAAGKAGKISVVVGREGSMAFIRVSDNGCGMSADFIEERLFRPFQTTKKKGFGVGLYQCKTIAEAHSGRLIADSEEGCGSDFTLYLPLAQA